jgi:hypothetical protein
VKPVAKQIKDEYEHDDEEVDNSAAIISISYSWHLTPDTISYLQHVVKKKPDKGLNLA